MELPTYTYNRTSYTVDYRLQQFRAIKKNGKIVFINFWDDYGDRILCKMIQDNKADLLKIHL